MRSVFAAAVILVGGRGSAPEPSVGVGDGVDGGTPSSGLLLTYEVTFAVLNSGVSLGALQLDIEFIGSSGGRGGFVGNGSSVDCDSHVPGALVAFNNRDGTLRAGFIHTWGFARPSTVASCRFKSTVFVVVDDFDVRVTDSSDTDSNPVFSTPVAGASQVRLLE